MCRLRAHTDKVNSASQARSTSGEHRKKKKRVDFAERMSVKLVDYSKAFPDE